MADNQKPQVQTRGYQGYNTQVTKNTTLEWSYQGEMLKLVFSEELPEAEQTERRRYDYEHSWITCIPRAKCNDLFRQYDKIYKQKTTEPWYISISIAGVNQFGIGQNIGEDGTASYFARLVRNIDPNSLTSDLCVEYTFAAGEVIKNYDHTTGKFDERIIVADGEFSLFIEDMDSFIKAVSKAWNHANRVVDKTYKDMISGDIRAIGKKVGAELVSRDSAERNGVRYGQPSLFDGMAKPAETETVQSLEDVELPFA